MNRFAIVTSAVYKTHKQSSMIYVCRPALYKYFEAVRRLTTEHQGGSRFYAADKVDALLNATAIFSEINTDPKAQIIMTIEGLPALEIIPVVIFFYDGPDPGDSFAMFDDILPTINGALVQSFSSFVGGQATNLLSFIRGTAHTLSVSAMTPAILDAIKTEVEVRRGFPSITSPELIVIDAQANRASRRCSSYTAARS